MTATTADVVFLAKARKHMFGLYLKVEPYILDKSSECAIYARGSAFNYQ